MKLNDCERQRNDTVNYTAENENVRVVGVVYNFHIFFLLPFCCLLPFFSTSVKTNSISLKLLLIEKISFSLSFFISSCNHYSNYSLFFLHSTTSCLFFLLLHKNVQASIHLFFLLLFSMPTVSSL